MNDVKIMKINFNFSYKKIILILVMFFTLGLIPTISLLKPSIELIKSKKKVNESNQKISIKDEATGKHSRISMHELLKGALAAEMLISFEIEALKAQVVAIHTYFLKQNLKNLKNYRICVNREKNSYIKTFAFISLNERKKLWGKKFEKYESKIETAVSAVENKLLFFKNELAYTFFFSWCYKKTTSCDVAFWQDIPYLTSIDSREYDSKLYPNLKKSKLEIKRSEMINILKSKFGKEGFLDKLSKTKEDQWIKILEKLDNGYVKKASILDEEIKGKDLKSLLGVKTGVFRIKYNSKEEKFEIESIGLGHGVGMSQYGADYYAKKGMSYEQILQHYYPGTEIRQI